MTSPITFLTALFLLIQATQAAAQFGGGGGASGSSTGPSFSGEMLKLFGENKDFSADLEFQVREGGAGAPLTMPGKIEVSDGKTRFEMDLTQAKGEQIPPEAIGQLKQMGMDKMVTVSLPKKDLSYLIYPGLEAYVQLPINDPDANASETDFEMEITELGKEEVAGHKCIKNKVVVTEKDSTVHESTVWNAIDLKKFPVKIETTEDGHEIVLLFTNVKLTTPAASQFSPPSSYTKYDNMMAMMQEIMMKRMGGAAGGMPQGQ